MMSGGNERVCGCSARVQCVVMMAVCKRACVGIGVSVRDDVKEKLSARLAIPVLISLIDLLCRLYFSIMVL
jgi:hypothetical protein